MQTGTSIRRSASPLRVLAAMSAVVSAFRSTISARRGVHSSLPEAPRMEANAEAARLFRNRSTASARGLRTASQPSSESTLAAIDFVCGQYRTALREGANAIASARAAERTAAIEATAALFRRNARGAYAGLLDEADRLSLGDFEPARIGWNVFRLFEKQESEPHWTRWVANLLRPVHGKACASLVWRAICSAAARSRPASPVVPLQGKTIPQGTLATPDDWRAAAAQPPDTEEIEDESSETGLGRVDLAVSTPGLLAIVENKLWESWHDWEPSPGKISRQADRYRQMGLERRGSDQKVGLLIVSANDLEVGPPGDPSAEIPSDWVFVHWRGLGQSLRGELADALQVDASVQRLLDLWPVILTLASIEQDILRFDIVGTKRGEISLPEVVRNLRALADWVAYLRRERHAETDLV